MFCFTLNFPNAELSVLKTDLNLISPVDDLFNRSDRFRGQSDWSLASGFIAVTLLILASQRLSSPGSSI